jgi:hypothetical protein
MRGQKAKGPLVHERAFLFGIECALREDEFVGRVAGFL